MQQGEKWACLQPVQPVELTDHTVRSRISWKEKQQHTPGDDWGREAPVLSWLELLWSLRLLLPSSAGWAPTPHCWSQPTLLFPSRDWRWSSSSWIVEMIELKNSPAGFFEDTLTFFLVRLIPASDSPDCTGIQTGSTCLCVFMLQSAAWGPGGVGRAA